MIFSCLIDGGALSSDGGILVLREIEKKLGFARILASCLQDDRDPARLTHEQDAMIRERIFAIACGYEDCDDLDGLPAKCRKRSGASFKPLTEPKAGARNARSCSSC